MEERNLEMDDDGKIKFRKSGALPHEEDTEGNEIVIDVPDFDRYAPESNKVGLTEEELAEKAAAQERRALGKRQEAEKLLGEAEELFVKGDLDGAGEKYLDSAALFGEDWRAWFGVVRVQTKDFTDFSEIYDCEKAYDKAFRRMPAEDKAVLAEKYVPSMESMISGNAEKIRSLEEKDEKERESEREETEKAFSKSRIFLIIFGTLFVLFAAAAITLSFFVYSVPGKQIFGLAIGCGVAAIVLMFVSVYSLKKFLLAFFAYRANRTAGTTEWGKQAALLRENTDLIQSVIDDFKA